MVQNYEFSYQSPKQKLALVGWKVLVLIFLLLSIYSLGWKPEEPLEEKINDVGGIFMAFWVYANLLKVKTEVKELFVPPFNIFNAIEFLAVGGFLMTYHQLHIVYNILQLKGIL